MESTMRVLGFTAAAVFFFVMGDVFGVEGASRAFADALAFVKGALSNVA